MALGGDGAAPTPVDDALGRLAGSLDTLVQLVESGGLEAVDPASLVGFVQGFERVRNRMALVDHAVVSAAAATDLPGAVCQPTVTRVLAATLRISPAEAKRRVRAAEAVGRRTSMLGEDLGPRWPRLAAVQRTGQVSPEQVGIVERALARVDGRGFAPARVDAGEDLLVDFATTFGPVDLRRLADQVVDAIDPDGTVPDEELIRDRRHVHLRQGRDGSWSGEFRLTGPVGAKLAALFAPLAQPRPGTGLSELDTRTHGQRQHDALEEICDRLLRSPGLPDTGGTPATVIVTIDLDDLLTRAGYGTTSDGTIISARQVRHLVNSAEVYPAFVTARGVVLALGRTRRIATRAQTLALIARDRGCSFPGCSHPPEWCERHHITDWADGGPTDLTNLTLLCRYHHHQFLSRGWSVTINTDGLPEWRPPRWLDREQTPLVNTRITAALAARTYRRRGPTDDGAVAA